MGSTKKIGLMSVLFLLIGLSFTSFTSEAAEGNSLSYSVEAELPNNQIKEVSYFYLSMTPAQEQTVYIRLSNHSNQEIKFNLTANTARTNSNGTIDYTDPASKQDPSLIHSFSELVSIEPNLTVPAHETKKIPVVIKMPKELFKGVILGGIHIQQLTKESDENSKANLQIKNQFAHVIGMALTESNELVQPNLNMHEIKQTVRDEHPIVTANIQNNQAMYLEELEIETGIYSADNQLVTQKTTQNELKMAPNSNFDFMIPLNNQPLEPGEYKLIADAKSPNQKWHFEKKFKVLKNQKKAADSASWSKKTKSTSLNYLWVVLVILFLVYFAFILGRQTKKNS
ncbi:DUF916 and DUF3324 domain-containing protein [Carnobacterium maltaromaticum]|uniref:DUF916 and DUF3324 domain-containing protein n=1 Tax=Carnobacterium maltaromaticum TaxID=2751 RepID=UPI0039B0541A